MNKDATENMPLVRTEFCRRRATMLGRLLPPGDLGRLVRPGTLWARQNSKLVANTETVIIMGDKNFPNSGILFRNDRKRDGSKDPDYTGTCDVSCDCGKRFTRKLAGWVKTGRNGKFLTVSLKPRPEGDDAQTTADDDARV